LNAGTIRSLLARPTVRHAAIVFAALTFVNAANFGFHLGAIRLLGLSAYGALAAVFAMLFVLSVPATVLQAVVASTIGELSASADVAALLRTGARMFRVACVAAVAIAAVGFVLAAPIDRYLTAQDVATIRLAWAAAALGFAVAVLRGVLLGTERFGAFAVSLGIEAGGNVFIGLPALATHHGIRAAMLANVCAVTIALAYSAWSARPSRGGGTIVVDLRRLAAKFAGTAGALVALAAMAWSDVVLIRHFGTAYMSGLYGALSIIGKIVLFSVSFLPIVLLPKVARSGMNAARARMLLAAIGGIGLVMCAAELVLVSAFPNAVLFAVAGRAGAGAAPYLPYYTAAICALAMTTILVNYNVARHRFAFLLPLLLIELFEIVAIYREHATIGEVVRIVLTADASALVLCVLMTWLADARRPRAPVLVQEPGR
jgi:O-antigen/teichoic acid export membrane protein